jgi:hypothetical protein
MNNDHSPIFTNITFGYYEMVKEVTHHSILCDMIFYSCDAAELRLSSFDVMEVVGKMINSLFNDEDDDYLFFELNCNSAFNNGFCEDGTTIDVCVDITNDI